MNSNDEYLLKAINAFGRKFIVISEDFDLLAVNSFSEKIKPSNVIGKKCYAAMHGRSAPCEYCSAVNAIKNNSEALSVNAKADLSPAAVPCFFSYPLTSKDEDSRAFAVMDFDLPIDKKFHGAIKNSRVFLNNLLDSAVDCILAADKKGRVLVFNEASSNIFGYTKDEALNNINIRDIYDDSEAYRVMKKLRAEESGGRGRLTDYKTSVINKSGESIPIKLNASIIHKDDEEIATIGIFHDMREELELQNKLEQTRLQLLQAEKMSSLGKLSAGVAHEINNPLGGITLYAKLMLEDYDLEEGAREDLERILSDAGRCRNIVKELLEFSRQTRRVKVPGDIKRAVLRTILLLENQTLFQNIKIEKEIEESLPLVNADIQQLNHVFMNIILNAAQAMKGRGRLLVKIWAGPARLYLEFVDTGPGIPDDILPLIFDPFFTTKDEGEGTGLGLSLVYSIIKDHGGTLTVDSEAGRGTTFIIGLPRGAAKSDQEVENES